MFNNQVLEGLKGHKGNRFGVWTIPLKTERGKLAEQKRCRKFAGVRHCQEWGLAEALEECLDEGSCSWWGLRSRTDVLHNLRGRVVTLLSGLPFQTAKFPSDSHMSPQEEEKKIGGKKQKQMNKNIWEREILSRADLMASPLKQQMNSSCLDDIQWMHYYIAHCTFPHEGLTLYHPSSDPPVP